MWWNLPFLQYPFTQSYPIPQSESDPQWTIIRLRYVLTTWYFKSYSCQVFETAQYQYIHFHNFVNYCTSRFNVEARIWWFKFCVAERTQIDDITITRIIVYCSTIGIISTSFFCFLNTFVVAIIVVITMSQDLLFPNTCNRKDWQLYLYILINVIKQLISIKI